MRPTLAPTTTQISHRPSCCTGYIAFVRVLVDQRKKTAVAFLEAAVAYFAKLGVRIERVMTDNGLCYRSKLFRAACKRFGLRQIFTRPYSYNWHRPHGSLKANTPISRLGLSEDNVLRLHS